jgi:hypothetical protein
MTTRWTRENFDQKAGHTCRCQNAAECELSGCGWLTENNRRLDIKLKELRDRGCSIR